MMKMIDVLVKLADGEIKEGTKLIVKHAVYRLNTKGEFVRKTDSGNYISLHGKIGTYLLNLEVKLIEVEENEND